ncbi:MAG: proton-conducting transporter membrane subunit [Acidimicrobiia bacterium]|nr:proton-conducting transporter membrane subunit [Acidimicrobiia bacterium]MDX2466694.1 proton-conducting transporter membrane subunit [Acidimicrobiia bacterium]
MSWLLPAVVAIPVLGAGLTVLVGRRLLMQRIIALGGVGFVLVAAVLLLVSADSGDPQVAQIGGWAAPAGITLIADRFAAIVLTVSAAMLLAVLAYAMAQLGRDAVDWWFHSKYLVLTAGIALSLITGDLFNLFVGFEIMLIASYVLLTVKAGPDEVRATMTYVVINLVASALFLVAIAFVYTTTGTLNLADLSQKLADVDPAVRSGLSMLMLVVFGIKAAIFPLFMWLPDSYPTAPTPVTAIFAGLLTKVGVFVIIRTQTLLFSQDEPSTLLLFVAGATMTVGVLGAIAQNDVKRILSFHIVSQIGYMIMGLGFLSVAGLAAAILYITHHIVVKTGLFLVGGLVEADHGTGALDRIGGVLHRRPVIAVLFLPLALSLAGIPPFSGFVAKLALIQEGMALDRGLIVAVSLMVGLLTLFSMTKIWGGVFWGEPTEATGRSNTGMVAATLVVVTLSLSIAIFASPIAELAERAAADLVDPAIYADAVLGGR